MRSALDRSGAVAAEREERRTCGPAVESFAQTPGAIAGDRSALHERSRHTGFAAADHPTRSMVRPRRILVRSRNRASGLSIPALGLTEIAVPAISLSRISSACRCTRVGGDVVFASTRTWRTTWQAGPAGPRREACPAFCCARRAKADHYGKRA